MFAKEITDGEAVAKRSSGLKPITNAPKRCMGVSGAVRPQKKSNVSNPPFSMQQQSGAADRFRIFAQVLCRFITGDVALAELLHHFGMFNTLDCL